MDQVFVSAAKLVPGEGLLSLVVALARPSSDGRLLKVLRRCLRSRLAILVNLPGRLASCTREDRGVELEDWLLLEDTDGLLLGDCRELSLVLLGRSAILCRLGDEPQIVVARGLTASAPSSLAHMTLAIGTTGVSGPTCGCRAVLQRRELGSPAPLGRVTPLHIDADR